MKISIIIICCLLIIGCDRQDELEELEPIINTIDQEQVLNEFLVEGARKYHYTLREWDEWIMKGLEVDSTVAYLWQQKALPYWKQKKYQLAISCYNKAVQFNRKRWLSRLGFLKCIFAKDYIGSLADLKTYISEFGSTVEQDHSLEIYMGICYLQLNQFDNALKALEENVEREEKIYGADWVHYLDRYYLAIAYYEKGYFNKAIVELDKVLIEYDNFSDAQYYKSLCLNYLGNKNDAKSIMADGKLNFESGFTFNEDSNLYEDYPYQITWQWNATWQLLQ